MKTTKKSETLEIRLSYPDKKALREKAVREGRSVSAILRDLISGYLAEPDECNHSTDWKAHLMALKPKTLIATGFAALALPFTLAPFAAAETVAIELSGEYISPEGNERAAFNQMFIWKMMTRLISILEVVRIKSQ